MKRAFYLILFFSFYLLQGQTQYTSIPDPNFEAALAFYDDISQDGQVPTAAIDTITVLDISNRNITNITGIQDFSALKELYAYNNQITTADFSQNTLLERVSMYFNNLTDINVSVNTQLKTLQIFNNQLSQLDVSGNPNLIYLGVYNNQLSQIDVSQNTYLTYLYISNNQISQLDLSQNTYLYRLTCMHNQLTQLDVSNNTFLWELDCRFNQINALNVTNLTQLSHLYVSGNQISILNLNFNSSLTEVSCDNNQLTNLFIQNGNNTAISVFNATNNPDLHCIFVDDANWSTQHWSNIDSQTIFVETQSECDSNSIENQKPNLINIYPNPATEYLNIETEEKYKATLYDITCKTIKTFNVDENYRLNLQDLPPGLYLLKLNNRNSTILKKIIRY